MSSGSSPRKTVLFTAAHSGFNVGQVPLGGGAAVCTRLDASWRETKPFPYEILGPSLLKSAPQNHDLVTFSEVEYARFCRAFEGVVTENILKRDPGKVVVLSNDVSEGPDFRRLSRQGYAIYTIYHVDVVDYFSTFYLRGVLRPQTTTATYRRLRQLGISRFVPDMLQLVWDKQEASVLCSRGLIVPSHRMKEVLLACYPTLTESRVHVLPWGIWKDSISESEVDTEMRSYRDQFPGNPEAFKLLLLSRISPEKGQHRLLEALALWEKESDFPAAGVRVFLSGEAAYMMGKRYEKKLRKLARKLRRTQVHFVGYAAGAKKQALFKSSDLYVFPSIHESYGLTMIEALAAGLPVLTTPSYGAQEIYQPGMGSMISNGRPSKVPNQLMEELRRLWKERQHLKSRGAFGAAWARNHNFSVTASKLAALLASQ